MKVIIRNREFEFDTGCKLLKLMHENEPCPMEELTDLWDDIQPITFQEIMQITNLEKRRIAFEKFGIEKLLSNIKSELIDSQTLRKTSMWVNEDGSFENVEYDDTYELYRVDATQVVDGAIRSWFSETNPNQNLFFVKCKDTSTDREYLIWVDGQQLGRNISDLNAIQAIAWTFTTNIPQGYIEKIVRQGDCLLIKPDLDKMDKKGINFMEEIKVLGAFRERHLTEEEYRNLLVHES
jgi:hypothetical protein